MFVAEKVLLLLVISLTAIGRHHRVHHHDGDGGCHSGGHVRITMATFSLLTGIKSTLITRFMGPTWGPSGADRSQLGPMLAPWTLLSGKPVQLFWKTCSRWFHLCVTDLQMSCWEDFTTMTGHRAAIMATRRHKTLRCKHPMIIFTRFTHFHPFKKTLLHCLVTPCGVIEQCQQSQLAKVMAWCLMAPSQ